MTAAVRRITIPRLAKPLQSNVRMHPRQRDQLIKTWREGARVIATTAGPPDPIQHAHVTYYLSHGDRHNRRRDTANWMPTVKACLDGITRAGALEDDDDRHITGPDPRLGPVLPAWTLVIELDPECACHTCAERRP